jgi:cytochrome b6-f complex iron-sulfur subunit
MANDETDRCSNCSKRAVNRRELLMLAGATTGLLVLGGAVSECATNPTGTPPTGQVAAGNISALAVGALLVMSNFVVARDANGVYAMSAVCTHAGCLLDDSSEKITSGLSCPCHGSTFDGNGTVTRGPAGSPLDHYAVMIATDGSITVDGSQVVSPSTRTAAG